MPLGDQQGPTGTQYQISAQSVESVGEYKVTFTCTPSTDNLDAPEVADIVQKFVDLINASPDFHLTSATRTYDYAQSITPTAGS
jgi:hypothetical protein